MSRIALSSELLINAYCRGIFPMSHEGEIYWYDPDPRAILPLDRFVISKSLLRSLKRSYYRQDDNLVPLVPISGERKTKKPPFELRINSDFDAVIRACAAPTRPGGWIDEEIIRAYVGLHRDGWAHCVETWVDGQLVGGLYGVAVGGLFAGESMFSHVTDASKVALAYLVHHMRNNRFTLLDVQFHTSHLARFGVVEVPKEHYHLLLGKALMVDPPPRFGSK